MSRFTGVSFTACSSVCLDISVLQICPRKLKNVAQRACVDARRNSCTIDSCEN